MNALTLACSPDGGENSIAINQDVRLYIGKLAAQGKISHTLGELRHGWVQLIEGDLDLNGSPLKAGDGAALDCETEIRLQSQTGAHFLFFDLN
jgi:redox-sensitive bicupin YhaK (pirin superfamily)